jgi:drug/metabolite transporter (DMT)-like permease
MKKNGSVAIGYAFGAAALYALNVPLSKYLLRFVTPTMMAALLYLGAGLGIGILYLVRFRKTDSETKLTKEELPFTLGMILLDIAAPIFLMMGLKTSSPESASLLGNFEIVATSLIALVLFSEKVSKRLWIAIALITLSTMVLSFESSKSLSISTGWLFILAACLCWGLENNCTRKLSSKSTAQIVTLKGLFSGLGSLIIALLLGESLPPLVMIGAALLLGFAAYGLSIFLYIRAQRDLGAAKTSAYYAIAPFLGVAFSFILFQDHPSLQFLIALGIMIIGSYFSISDTIVLQHTHSHVHLHTHEHRHDGLTHIHAHAHEHVHLHTHENATEAEHVHTHAENEAHDHVH